MFLAKRNLKLVWLFTTALVIDNCSRSASNEAAPGDVASSDHNGEPATTISTEEFVRQAGYVPLVFNLPTQPGYVINLIRIFNPLINNNKRQADGSKPIRKRKRSVLFIHGVFGNANQWILMGVKSGKPQDWSKVDAKNMSDLALTKLIANDSTARAMPFFLSNLGHDVWIVNRRPTTQSRLVNLNEDDIKDVTKPHGQANDNIVDEFQSFLSNQTKSQRNKYFDFSHDEQSAYDLPMIIKHILNVSKSSKLNIVAHGTGCLIALQTIARNPEFNQYVNHLAMLGPIVNVHNLHYNNANNVLINLLANNEFGLATSLGALDPVAILPTIMKLSIPICEEHKLRNFPCGAPNDEIFGYGSNQYDEEVANSGPRSWAGEASFHELAQIIQATFGNEIHYFDFRMPLKNKRNYNSTDIKKYDLNNVKLGKISIWRGNTDRFANQYDTYSLMKKLAIGSK